jgi:hypothetical protein
VGRENGSGPRLDSAACGCYKMRRQHEWTVQQAVAEAAQGQYTRETQEVEERSRWRWSPRRLAYIGIKTGSFPLGPGRSVGPFPYTPIGADQVARLPPA